MKLFSNIINVGVVVVYPFYWDTLYFRPTFAALMNAKNEPLATNHCLLLSDAFPMGGRFLSLEPIMENPHGFLPLSSERCPVVTLCWLIPHYHDKFFWNCTGVNVAFRLVLQMTQSTWRSRNHCQLCAADGNVPEVSAALDRLSLSAKSFVPVELHQQCEWMIFQTSVIQFNLFRRRFTFAHTLAHLC